ncbi:hypothetical protein [Streptomyces bambusae]|uniref:Secreted protein n=1 Tax=Streptomyces bambusae TaxID=1550616 RepID=A0ABS6ZD33_9ACTN|nr:hypothetical protein [Streptomyces bambusae]MBW5485133.1 hypothetical protein [Streptomyces bambusae]
MAHHTLARAAAGATLVLAVALVSAPTAHAAARPGGAAGALAGPLSLDNLLSLGFLAPTVRDAKRQVSGLASGLSPAPANAAGLGSLLK